MRGSRLLRLLVALLLLLVPGVAHATFADVVAVAGDADVSATTSRDIPLASGTSAGNLLIVGVACRSSTVTMGWPGDWSQLVHTTQSVASSRVWLDVYYKIAEGSETTVTVTTSSSVGCAWYARRITGHDSGTPPEAAASSGASPASPNPPNLTPSWGAADTLWLIFGGWPNTGGVTSYSTNYINTAHEAFTDSSAAALGTGERELNAVSENPDAWVLVTAGNVSAATVAIRPATGAVGGVGGMTLRGAGK